MDFTQQLKDAGIPTTEAELTAEFAFLAKKQDFYPLNTSGYSPFWRLIQALFTSPMHQLTLFLVKKIIPNGFLKTASGQALDLLAYPYAIERKKATFATGHILFTKSAITKGIDIPKNTIIRTPLINGKIYKVKTTEAVTILPNEATLLVPVIAFEPGYNSNLGEAYYSILEEPVDGIYSAKNLANWITTPGADEESDDALRLRIRNIYLAAAQWHTNAKYTAMITEFAGIDTDRVYFDNNAPRGPGTADIYILFDVADDSITFLDNIQDYVTIQGNHGHGDDIQIKALPAFPVTLPVTIRFKDNVTQDEKSQAILRLTDFMRCAFRENNAFNPLTLSKTYPFKTFAFSQLFAEAHAICPHIASLRTDALDPAPGLKIPRLQSLTITEAN